MTMFIFYCLFFTLCSFGVTMIFGPFFLMRYIKNRNGSDINFIMFFADKIVYTEFGYKLKKTLSKISTSFFLLMIIEIIMLYLFR